MTPEHALLSTHSKRSGNTKALTAMHDSWETGPMVMQESPQALDILDQRGTLLPLDQGWGRAHDEFSTKRKVFFSDRCVSSTLRLSVLRPAAIWKAHESNRSHTSKCFIILRLYIFMPRWENWPSPLRVPPPSAALVPAPVCPEGFCFMVSQGRFSSPPLPRANPSPFFSSNS